MWRRQVWAHLWILLHFPSSAKVKACCLILRKYETMGFWNLSVSLIAIYLRKKQYSLSNNECFDDYFSTASLFLPGCTLTPLVGLENVAQGDERNRFALAANFAHLRYPPTRQHTTCALFHSLENSWELFQKVGWAGKGVVGLATIYVGGTLESPRWLDPLCFLRVLLHAAWGGLGPGQKY